MMISFICVFTYIFAVLINKVSLQVTVEGFVGGSVVLPCSSAEHVLKLQDTDVHWRHNSSKIVYDLVKGEDSLEEQDPRYKNRTKTFPEECVRGNFSISLSDLTHADAGKYNCLITPSSKHETVELIINEEGNTRIEEETRPDSGEKSWLWILVVPLLTELVILIIAIIFRKKIPSCRMSVEHCMGSDTLEDVNPDARYKSVTADDCDEAAKAGE
ncbi:ICOS ligand-like [Carassius auratus]|uniref:ICOS ligand-like n=1 Tax=Carassius auratus TaxID=7957 RepID=A0A6P6J1N8_CARAU|nr:ICOS ligand-like [Carassius auratus]